MNGHFFTLRNAKLVALPSGALWWPEQQILCVSDLHFGKSDRIARRSGGLLPPYEVRDTLLRLESDIAAAQAKRVICLGDSWDDLRSAETLPEDERFWLIRLMADRDWIWIEGNHDPGPIDLAGRHMSELGIDGLTFRHMACLLYTSDAADE